MNFLERDRLGMYADERGGPGPELMGADTLLGNEVLGPADRRLGEILEIMIDMRSGRIAYAVLAFDAAGDRREKLFAVPWSALRLDTARRCFGLDVEPERLEQAPGFDPGAWPRMADAEWSRTVHDWYGARAWWE